jgi:hypothetical protein
LAAIKAATDTDAAFDDAPGMRAWVRGLDPGLISDSEWPTLESRGAWVEFTRRLRQRRRRRWEQHTVVINDVEWDNEVPDAGTWLRVTYEGEGSAGIWSPGFDRLATVQIDLNEHCEGVLHAVRIPDGGVELRYRGPNDWLLEDVQLTK